MCADRKEHDLVVWKGDKQHRWTMSSHCAAWASSRHQTHPPPRRPREVGCHWTSTYPHHHSSSTSRCNSSMLLFSALLFIFTLTTTLAHESSKKADWPVTSVRPRYRTLYACEGSSLEIICEEGTHINLIRANFGRFSISVCNEHGNVEWSVDCMSHRSFRVIQERCSGRSDCRIEASVATFAEDACPRVHKYLEVHFNCTAPRPPTAMVAPSASPSSIPSDPSLNISHNLSAVEVLHEENERRHLPVLHQLSPSTSTRGDIDLRQYELKEQDEVPPNSSNSSDIGYSSIQPGHLGHLTSTIEPPFSVEPVYRHDPPGNLNFASFQEPTAKPPKPYESAYDDRSLNSGQYQSSSPAPYYPTSYDMDDLELVSVSVVPPVEVDYARYCRPMYAKTLNWNWTIASSVAQQACPAGAKGIARWSCITGADGESTWTPHLPDMSNCSSLWISHLLERTRSHRDSVFSLAEELAKGAKGKILYSGDLISAADIIKQLVTRLETKLEESKDDQERRAHLIKELLNSVLNVASNLLEEVQMESWHELNLNDQRATIRTMTRALERIAQLLADVRSQPNYNYVRTHNNILLSVHVHSMASLEHGLRLPLVLSQYDSVSASLGESALNEVSAYLPYEALVEHANENGQVKVIFLMYRGLANLLRVRHLAHDNSAPVHLQPYAYKHFAPEHGLTDFDWQRVGLYHARAVPVTTIVNSDVVGLIIASEGHQLPTSLAAPLELTLRHLRTENITNGRCAFWDMKHRDEESTLGEWSTAGCETLSSNRTHTVCRCHHLTNFAVLMDISNTPMEARDEFALKLITRIGCAISIISLAVTFLTLSLYKSLKSIRNSIHKHLCACLLVAEVIFLLGIDETRIKLVCGLIAIALHYFFMAAFLWMFFEGLQLYTMLVQVFEHRHNRLVFYSLVAYGAPALLVIVAALVDPLSYGTPHYCWLRADNHFVWSFLGPALVVLFVNALFLAMAMSVMCRHSSASFMSSTTFAVHQKQQQQQPHLKVYPSPMTPSPSYSITEHSKMHSIRIWVRTSFALVVVLGLTWTFGVLYLSHSTIFMAYIFTLLNSLQGLFIFIFCCLLNDKVRTEYHTTFARGIRRCFLFRSMEPSSLAFSTKSSTDSTRSTSLRDSHHLMMNGAAAHHLSQQHLYMQQPAASFIGSRNAGPRTSLLYLNELLGKSEPQTTASTPTADQPLITSQMLQQPPTSMANQSQHSLEQQQQPNMAHMQLSQALSSLNQINLPDDASSSDYGCRRLTQMIEHIYECIDEDPYVAKLLLPAIKRSLDNHQARANLRGTYGDSARHPGINPSILATLGRTPQRDITQHMRLQPNSSYLSSGNSHHTIHGGLSSLHLPAIVRDNTANSGKTSNGSPAGFNHLHSQPPQNAQQTVALLDGDQVRCCTLPDHKLCDHQSELGISMQNSVSSQNTLQMLNALKAASVRHHLASEC